ncbi:hypothetical protein [Nocardia spumae]|uniref:hypothetical protein n=1 Tax=Nocardia spumae TaxID=2887190 RepID=UPI001D14AE56|nr:hypothetical protein [Nocardia spumae]
MTEDDSADRIRPLGDRAARAGYRLMRDPARPDTWILLDAASGEPVHSESSLDRIEEWLNE